MAELDPADPAARTSSATPPGWYPDPWSPGATRWWDGTQWTSHAAAGTPPAMQQTAAAAAPGSPPSTVYNPWIWLVVFAPSVSLIALLFFRLPPLPSFSATTDPGEILQWELGLMFQPALVVSAVLGWAGLAVAIVSAYRDWRWLRAAGVQRPFHWGFVFLNLAIGPVYAIGRAVVTRQRTGKGMAVLWATIGMILLGLGVGVVLAVVIFAQIMGQITQMVG